MNDQDHSMAEHLNNSKNIEHYSQTCAAWYGTALEHDKSLLTLSVAGIGVLVSIMQTTIYSALTFSLYAGAIVAFLVCLTSVLSILKKNKKYLADILAGTTTGSDPCLAKLDKCAKYSFNLAMILSVILGLLSGYTHINDSDTKMTNDSKTPSLLPAGTRMAQDSFDLATDLQKSFNGAAVLQQGNNTNQTATPAPSQPQNTNLGTTGK